MKTSIYTHGEDKKSCAAAHVIAQQKASKPDSKSEAKSFPSQKFQAKWKKSIQESPRVLAQRSLANQIQLKQSPFIHVIQRFSDFSSDKYNYGFVIDKNDFAGGTDTTKSTQNYVNNNSEWPSVPGNIEYGYQVYNKKGEEVDTDSGDVKNPAPATKGQRWDAGHSLGRQNGGKGNVKKNVFPQNPQINRGNYFQGKKTFKMWRSIEDQFHDSVENNHHGVWTMKLT
jgi:hypothetical protein